MEFLSMLPGGVQFVLYLIIGAFALAILAFLVRSFFNALSHFVLIFPQYLWFYIVVSMWGGLAVFLLLMLFKVVNL